MERNKHDTSATTRPAATSTGIAGHFHPGAPASGVPATIMTADWAEGVQEELMAVIEEAGLTASISDYTQLRQAVATLAKRSNLIINAGFDIWQRGTSLGAGQSGTKFLADRWAVVSNGSTFAASQQAFSVGQTAVPGEPVYYHRTVVTSVTAAGNYCRMRYRIEDVRTFAAGKATIVFWAKADAAKPMAISLSQGFGTGGSASVLAIGATKFNVTTSWAKYSATVTVPTVSGKTIGSKSFVQLDIWMDAGSDNNASTGTMGQQSGTFDVANVQIEPGSNAAPFEFVPLADELARCQRYYEKSFDLATAPAQNAGTSGASTCLQIVGASTATKWLTSIDFKAAKRTTPTVTLYNPSAANAQARNVTGSSDCASTTATATENGMTIAYTSASGSALGNEIALHWAAEAEL
jgi:hypothetical protein